MSTSDTTSSDAASGDEPFIEIHLNDANDILVEVNPDGTITITGELAGTPFSETIPCYCRGTLIQTANGEVAVEDLKIGDAVMTASGALKPIRWIGSRGYVGRFLAGKTNILPVRIKAGALADGQPRRDLYVSPEHAMFIDGVLVPAGQLVNGVSITQPVNVERVDYFHVELEQHDVILAEGAASETFVDDASRMMFHNASEYAKLHPEAASVPAVYCAPRVTEGYALEDIRRTIDLRAGLLRSVAA